MSNGKLKVIDLFCGYRLAISKENIELFLIQDPVEKYRNKLIKMSPRNGADIVFSEKSGTKEELLVWAK